MKRSRQEYDASRSGSSSHLGYGGYIGNNKRYNAPASSSSLSSSSSSSFTHPPPPPLRLQHENDILARTHTSLLFLSAEETTFMPTVLKLIYSGSLYEMHQWINTYLPSSIPGSTSTPQFSSSSLPLPAETDEHRIAQRQRQIDMGKNTLGYMRYRAVVPRSARFSAASSSSSGCMTPDPSRERNKRSWENEMSRWRRYLHDYDVGLLGSSSSGSSSATPTITSSSTTSSNVSGSGGGNTRGHDVSKPNASLMGVGGNSRGGGGGWIPETSNTKAIDNEDSSSNNNNSSSGGETLPIITLSDGRCMAQLLSEADYDILYYAYGKKMRTMTGEAGRSSSSSGGGHEDGGALEEEKEDEDGVGTLERYRVTSDTEWDDDNEDNDNEQHNKQENEGTDTKVLPPSSTRPSSSGVMSVQNFVTPSSSSSFLLLVPGQTSMGPTATGTTALDEALVVTSTSSSTRAMKSAPSSASQQQQKHLIKHHHHQQQNRAPNAFDFLPQQQQQYSAFVERYIIQHPTFPPSILKRNYNEGSEESERNKKRSALKQKYPQFADLCD